MRYNDWQTRLEFYVRGLADQPFVWGVHDCALFACSAIECITGVDPGAWFRGRYTTEAEATAALLEYAGGGLAATAEKICAELGFKENAPRFEQRGDVALCDQGGGDTLGIIDFTGRYVMIANAKGVVRIPLACVKRSWRVE